MYLIYTDNGYIGGGELHNKLQFVDEEDAKLFTESEINNFNTNDLHTYYCCNEIEVITIN